MHTILGSNGAVAKELSRALAMRSAPIRQVSRHPVRTSPTDQTLSADLLDAKATANAVAGSEVV